MIFHHTKELYDAGYALIEYSISPKYRYWRYGNEIIKTGKEVELPLHSIKLDGNLFNLPKIEDVRKIAI